MKYAIMAIAMILFAAVFHMVFIMFDYGFNDPNIGAFPVMRDTLNESMDPQHQQWAYNHSKMYSQFFGIGRVVCIVLCIVFFILEVLSRNKSVGGATS